MDRDNYVTYSEIRGLRILMVCINQSYHPDITERNLYDCTRGCWKVNIKKAKRIDYILGVANSIVRSVYKPIKWYYCNNDKNTNRYDDIFYPNIQNRETDIRDKRKFFIGDSDEIDPKLRALIGKSIERLDECPHNQWSIRYIYSHR